jgi:hypothetical protein
MSDNNAVIPLVRPRLTLEELAEKLAKELREKARDYQIEVTECSGGV